MRKLDNFYTLIPSPYTRSYAEYIGLTGEALAIFVHNLEISILKAFKKYSPLYSVENGTLFIPHTKINQFDDDFASTLDVQRKLYAINAECICSNLNLFKDISV